MKNNLTLKSTPKLIFSLLAMSGYYFPKFSCLRLGQQLCGYSTASQTPDNNLVPVKTYSNADKEKESRASHVFNIYINIYL